jgi:asparagine N-glycosylation enzyme membrane subunit Stt3
MGKKIEERKIEIIFITVLSVIIFAGFYTLTSMNGVVLGNDPSVHLQKAQQFLGTGKISLANIGWTPPLYEILLSFLITFSGAAAIGQTIFLVKALAVLIDWLLFMAVYLLARKFFNKKVGAAASVLLLMSFPMYELNAWGGYTTVLGLAFTFLVLLYLTLATENFGYLTVTFLAGFSLVLSHQLAAFLAVFIMPPVLLLMLIKSKGAYLKVVIALILGSGVAFFLYYLQAMIGYLDAVIYYVFFGIKTYVYQIPATTFNSFVINFGFIFFFGIAGIVVSYHVLKKTKNLTYYVILLLSFFVPLFFAESHYFGLYMPFQWFIYYLTPPLAVLAAVSLVFAADKVTVFYNKNKTGIRKNRAKIITVALVVLMSLMLVFRSDVVYGKVLEAGVYYSTSDIKAYDAGLWLNQNSPKNATVVVTQVPGSWFSSFSGKTVFAQTDHAVERNAIAESVLSLSDEIQTPQTLLQAYQAKGDITDENYVSINQVWYRTSYLSAAGEFIMFNQNGTDYKFSVAGLSRTISFDEQTYPRQVSFSYYNDYIQLTQTMTVENDSYPINVSWAVSPLKSDIFNASLYLTNYFDLQFNFSTAQIPQFMNWTNPWDMPSKLAQGKEWAAVTFVNSTLKDSYIGLYDDKKDVAFAFKFNDTPDWGNIGALGNGQIDAVRFQYNFGTVGVNQTATRQYQTLTLSQNNYPTFQKNQLQDLFNLKPGVFTVESRDYRDFIAENNIGFIVYDKNQLNYNIAHCKFLELVYSNDRYAIFKVLNNYNQT